MRCLMIIILVFPKALKKNVHIAKELVKDPQGNGMTWMIRQKVYEALNVLNATEQAKKNLYQKELKKTQTSKLIRFTNMLTIQKHQKIVLRKAQRLLVV